MTTLKNIDMKAFKAECEASRAHMAATGCPASMVAFMHRENVQNGDRGWVVAVEEVAVKEATADDVRCALNVAARACQMKGATPAQINYIISLCEQRGDFGGLENTTRLTKGEASAIIDHIKKA